MLASGYAGEEALPGGGWNGGKKGGGCSGTIGVEELGAAGKQRDTEGGSRVTRKGDRDSRVQTESN